jgi:hypothetical protein
MNVHQIIIQGIKEQLFFNNFLVLPDFGGFILKKLPAHFSASGGMIFPPSKNIGFNAQLKQNDGILAHWLMSKLRCDQQQALAHLRDFSEYCFAVLNNKGRLNIEGLGFFYTDLENNLCFEPAQQTNFLASSFGLGPVIAKEIEQEPEKKEEPAFVDRVITRTEIVEEEKEQSQEKYGRKLRRYRRVAVAAVSGLLLISSVLFVVSNSKISGMIKSSLLSKENTASYSAINYSDLNIKTRAGSKSDYVADANGIASIELDNKSIAVKAVETENKTEKKNPTHKTQYSTGNFEVVLGCFSIQNNANRMIKKMQNEHHVHAFLSQKKHKGMFVVNAGGFDNKEAAINKLSEVKSAVPNAWIKKAE